MTTLFTLDIQLQDGTTFQRVFFARSCWEAMDKAIAKYPNFQSVGVAA